MLQIVNGSRTSSFPSTKLVHGSGHEMALVVQSDRPNSHIATAQALSIVSRYLILSTSRMTLFPTTEKSPLTRTKSLGFME